MNTFHAPGSQIAAVGGGGNTFDFSRVPAAVRPLVDAPPAARCELCVAIPVHNEEAGITDTLAALAAQTDERGRPLDAERYEVLVLANNCTDATVARARRFAADHARLRLHVVEVLLAEPHAHVGAARRLVMDEAARRLHRLGRARGVIATTDGDTVVREDWVVMNSREVEGGADAVGGRIFSTPREVGALDAGARRYYRRDAAYRTLRAAYECVLSPDSWNGWPRHHHCFGASLAVTLESYLRAGGLPVVPCLEDMAFGDALERIGARVRQSPLVGVLTSLRCAGRVGVGLSDTLRRWSRDSEVGAALLVESVAFIEGQCRNRERVRRLWREGRRSSERVARAAAELEVDADWLAESWRRAGGAGALFQEVWMHQRRTRTGPWGLAWTEVDATIAELRGRLAAHRPALRAAAARAARRARTDRAGRFPHGDLPGDATVLPWPRQTWSEPRRPSADNHGRAASNGPGAGGLPLPAA